MERLSTHGNQVVFGSIALAISVWLVVVTAFDVPNTIAVALLLGIGVGIPLVLAGRTEQEQ